MKLVLRMGYISVNKVNYLNCIGDGAEIVKSQTLSSVLKSHDCIEARKIEILQGHAKIGDFFRKGRHPKN